MHEITVDESVTLSVTFKDAEGQKVDPSTPVEVSVLRPNKTIDGPFTASRVSVGAFTYPYTPPSDGLYFYRFTSTDGGVEVGSFVVERDPAPGTSPPTGVLIGQINYDFSEPDYSGTGATL